MRVPAVALDLVAAHGGYISSRRQITQIAVLKMHMVRRASSKTATSALDTAASSHVHCRLSRSDSLTVIQADLPLIQPIGTFGTSERNESESLTFRAQR